MSVATIAKKVPPPTDKDGSITLDLIKFMKLYLIVASTP
jgi:hypothetical protein